MVLDESRWFVVQSQMNSENRAVVNLERQGFHTYLPKYLKRRRHARRIETVASPLFPRYLFVALDLNVHRWRSIFSTLGVSRIICNGVAPAPVPERVISALKDREDAAGFVQLDSRPRFQQGDQIRLQDGAFADCLALYEGMNDNDRVTVLLDLLGRKVRVMVDAEAIVAA